MLKLLDRQYLFSFDTKNICWEVSILILNLIADTVAAANNLLKNAASSSTTEDSAEFLCNSK
jgi:hypothetical protein